MINVNVLYPNSADCKFDLDYYLSKHIPMISKPWTPALQGVVVEHGVAGAAPGTPATYIAMCHLKFHSIEDFQGVFAKTQAEVMGDIDPPVPGH